LTLAQINIYLVSIAKSNGIVTQVWNPENPTAEISGQGAYLRVLTTADFEANDYLAYAQYTGAEVVDSIYSYGGVGGDGLAAEAIADISTLQTSVNTLDDYVDTEVAAIKAKTDLLTFDGANIIATLNGEEVTLSSALILSIADEVLKRGAAHVEDDAEELSLAEVILGAFESERDNTTWDIRKSNGDLFNSRTLTLDANANPVVGVD
jgi:hypothetical protein